MNQSNQPEDEGEEGLGEEGAEPCEASPRPPTTTGTAASSHTAAARKWSLALWLAAAESAKLFSTAYCCVCVHSVGAARCDDDDGAAGFGLL